MNERISREEVVKIYDIEVAFFDELEAVGLINFIISCGYKYTGEVVLQGELERLAYDKVIVK